MGIFEATISKLEEMALDYSKLDDGIILVKDREVFERHRALKTIYPGLVKQAQAVRTFLEGEKSKRYMEVGLKFIAIDSIIKDEIVDEGDDSIVKGSVGEGGAVWAIKNAGPVRHNRNISYGPMFFPSFKEWYRGRECLEELAVQRAFKGDNPYDKSLDEIDKAVAKLTGVNKVRYNTKEHIEKVTGPGSFQALDASYPIDEKFWPDWLKIEVEKFHKYRPH